MKRRFGILGAAILVVTSTAASGQQGAATSPPEQTHSLTTSSTAGGNRSELDAIGVDAVLAGEPGMPAQNANAPQFFGVGSPRQNELAKAMAAYRNAESDEDKAAAEKEIQQALEKQYDGFLEHQSKQIDELEDRIVKLKDQLQRRREAKSRMLELKLQMVISQAEGLGWPDQPGPGRVDLAFPSLPSMGAAVADPFGPEPPAQVSPAAPSPDLPPARRRGQGR